MRDLHLLAALLAVSYSSASESIFSVNDDVLAYPQYAVVFADSYVLEKDTQSRLRTGKTANIPPKSKDVPETDPGPRSELSSFPSLNQASDETDFFEEQHSEYKCMIMHGLPYLCAIPIVETPPKNITKEAASHPDNEEELARAADRGWELLQDMQEKPCLFFSTGWWSYSFCYNSQIKQFHSLPPGANGAPIYPPTEDPTTPSYVLGKFESGEGDDGHGNSDKSHASSAVTELQTKAETRYLVQRLSGGTECDLTRKSRKVEVQFHCHPQSTDRIGWIKETSTCAYLMIIYTPRLCTDVAFLPPKEVRANQITCEEILQPNEVADWEARKNAEATRKLIDQGSNQRLVVGDIEVGGMKEVGREGRRIEKGKVVSTPEERAETVVVQKNGKIEGLSKADLRKKNINPDAVEAFRKELQQRAGGRDWKIQIWDEANGQLELRGIISADPADSSEGERSEDDQEDDGVGSEERYKEDV